MKYQYRISTDSNGTSNFGYAYLLISNVSGSGRKLTLRSLEVYPHSVQSNIAVPASLYRGASISGGDDMVKNAAPMDSGTAIPSTVVVRRGGMIDTYANRLHHLDLVRRGGAVGSQNRLLFGTPMTIGKRRLMGMYGTQFRGQTTVEPITINQNEAVALVVDPTALSRSNPRRVNVVLSINGKTVTWDFNANTYQGLALFSVENTGSNTVKLLNYGVMDLGTSDTTMLRVVPVGQLYTPDIDDTSKQNVGVMKMDSTAPALSSSVCKLYTDVGFIPYGVPESAIADASTASPRQMNYLHTRDFIGPMYRNMLMETCHMKNEATPSIPDAFGCSYSHKLSDLLGHRAGIVINPGEALALVNSAETAVGVQASYGAWQPMTFAVQMDVEPQVSPYVTLNSMSSGSDVVILQAGTTTVLASADSVSGSSYSWNYDPDLITSIDVCVYKAGFKPYVLRGLTPGLFGMTIPVSQLSDPVYS